MSPRRADQSISFRLILPRSPTFPEEASMMKSTSNDTSVAMPSMVTMLNSDRAILNAVGIVPHRMTERAAYIYACELFFILSADQLKAGIRDQYGGYLYALSCLVVFKQSGDDTRQCQCAPV